MAHFVGYLCIQQTKVKKNSGKLVGNLCFSVSLFPWISFDVKNDKFMGDTDFDSSSKVQDSVLRVY